MMRRFALGVVPLLAACFDVVPVLVTEPVPPPSEPVQVHLFLDLGPGPEGLVLTVRGGVQPGSDTAGVETALAREPLRVMGRPVFPERLGEERIQQYTAAWEVAEVDSIPVALPPLPGLLSAAPRLGHPPRRVGPDTIVLRDGEDLVLQLEAAPLPAERARWSLSFSGMDGNLHLSRTGSPPAELRLPYWTLPDPNEGLLHVDLEADERLPFDTDPADLGVYASLRTRLRWVVRVTTGPGAATP